jgi:hypothetical protein
MRDSTIAQKTLSNFYQERTNVVHLSQQKKCFQLPDLALLGLTQSLARRQEVYTLILPMGLWILINQLTDRRD